ncbi:F-box only protein 36 isoform X4 [Macaca fascicularis]|uniref:F-box only protein 36 isoform X4 n=1 Tax=Macaca fascicularis TaxID=9541 RepID=UPI003D15A2E5
MASRLPETLFETVGQGPAPSKDYYQLLVTRSQVIFRWWKISLRSEYRSTKPGEAKEIHEDFLENLHLQSKFDFLERLSDNLLLNIISYLDLEDIARLSQTSHRFAKEYSPPDSSTTWTFQKPLACPAPLTCLPAELKGKDCVT